MGEPRFEEEMKRLEEIVTKIESGEVGLEDSIELCQEASRLVKDLKKRLAEAELKVQELSRDSEGELRVKEGEGAE